MRRTLAAELQQLSLQFRRQQRGFLEKLRAQQRQKEVAVVGSFFFGKGGGFDALLEGASRRGNGGRKQGRRRLRRWQRSLYFHDSSGLHAEAAAEGRGAGHAGAGEGGGDSRVVESISQLSEIMKDLGEELGVFFIFRSVQEKLRRRKKTLTFSSFEFFKLFPLHQQQNDYRRPRRRAGEYPRQGRRQHPGGGREGGRRYEGHILFV